MVEIKKPPRNWWFLKGVTFWSRYLLVGSANTLFGAISFPIAYGLLSNHVSSNGLILGVSYLSSTLFSFFTQRQLVFRSRTAVVKSGFRFVLLQFVLYGLNVFTLEQIVAASAFHPIICQALLLPFIVVGSLLAMRFWVFPEKRPSS